MEIKWHNKILVRISTVLLVLTGLSLTVFCWYGYSSSKSLVDVEMKRFTQTTAERLANYLGDSLANPDRKQIETLLIAELRDDRLASIIVKNVDQTVILGLEKSPDGAIEESRTTSRPVSPGWTEKIIHENRVLGSLELSVVPEFMAASLRQSVMNLSFLTACLNLFIGLALYLALRKMLILPMAELTQATENISLGRLEGAIVNHSKNELGQLTAAIERLRVSMRIAIKRLAAKQKNPAGINAEEWKDVILEKKPYGFEFLALRILVGRLSLNYRNNPTHDTMGKCVHQLVDFFQNEKNPLAQKDLHKIFGGVAR
jgi:HAMP domain-containing protein